jgi:hypothetical protein
LGLPFLVTVWSAHDIVAEDPRVMRPALIARSGESPSSRFPRKGPPEDIHAAETTMFAADRQIIWTERPQAQAEALDFSNWRLRAERGGSELDLLCISVELMDSIGLLHSSRP